ncbi:hypothetical protein PSACC_03247, partial [Paramicrosporidium saccamoebae]
REVARRVNKHVKDQMKELNDWKERYAVLQTKHEALQHEMLRSQQAFEKKCREWQVIKDTLSQKERLKALLSTIEDAPLKIQGSLHPSSTPIKRDPLDTDNGQSSEDPINFLGDVISTWHEDAVSDLDNTQTASVAVTRKAITPMVTTPTAIAPLKRQSPKFSEAMRSKSERKQAHARDCPCCTKYGLGENCIDSGRKERKRGVKRGPYRARGLLSTESSSPYSEKSCNNLAGQDDAKASEVWNMSDAYGRPMRNARKGVSYKDVGKEEESSSDSDSSDEPVTPKNVVTAKVSTKSLHSALFNMVLSTMHGDFEIPPSYPTLRDLAAVCAEVVDRGCTKVDPEPILFTDPFEAIRKFNNTPTPPPLFRDVPTPPGTPLGFKQQPHYNTVFAPVPLQVQQRYQYAQYSNYLARDV